VHRAVRPPGASSPETGVPWQQPGERVPTKRAFLLLRYALIAVTACLLLVEEGLRLPPVQAISLVVVALASNLVIAVLPAKSTSSPYFGPAIIAGDTLWITVALLVSGRFSAEFYFLYFFILLLAAIGESLRLITLATVAVCGAYVYVMSAAGSVWSLWTSPSLIRILFLFTAAIFYGYLVDRTRRQRQRVREAERIKSEFLGSISHELRTPLAVILGYVDLLREGEFGAMPAEQRDVLEKIHRAGENLHRYLTRLLDVSRLVNRLQSGHEAVSCSDFALASVFSELQNDFSDDRAALIRWPAVSDLPRLFSDREKLLTVLRNLVENGLKYGAGHPVAVAASHEPAADMIAVRVSDQGIGIASADVPHVFDPFRRTAGALKTDAQGVGLGLYIVREFVGLLGGTIDVESAPGRGSTFTVRVPRRLSRSTAAVSG
jgi:signal transduction histidine kinase